MSSTLRIVRVTAIKEQQIKLRVWLEHPDIWRFPTTKTFALQLLFEPIYNWRKEYRNYARGLPLFNALDWEDMHDRNYVCDTAAGFIESVTIDETYHYPITPDELAKALQIDDREQHPHADYTLTVTHFAWGLHLRVGMEWESTAYDSGEATPCKHIRHPYDNTWVRSPNQDEGFTTAQYIDTEQIEHTVNMPIYGAKYYEPDPVLSGNNITQSALQALQYQPVILFEQKGFHPSAVAVGSLVDIEENRIKIYRARKSYTTTFSISIEKIAYIGIARYRMQIWHTWM